MLQLFGFKRQISDYFRVKIHFLLFRTRTPLRVKSFHALWQAFISFCSTQGVLFCRGMTGTLQSGKQKHVMERYEHKETPFGQEQDGLTVSILAYWLVKIP
jgi:hypothetical protein